MFFGKNCVCPISPCIEPRVEAVSTPRSTSFSAATSWSVKYSGRRQSYASVAIDEREQRGLADLERAPARNDRVGAALGEKFGQREAETALAAIRVDGGGGVIRLHRGRDAGSPDALRARLRGELLLPAQGSPDALRARLRGELLLPALEAGRGVAACRRQHRTGTAEKSGEADEREVEG